MDVCVLRLLAPIEPIKVVFPSLLSILPTEWLPDVTLLEAKEKLMDEFNCMEVILLLLRPVTNATHDDNNNNYGSHSISDSNKNIKQNQCDHNSLDNSMKLSTLQHPHFSHLSSSLYQLQPLLLSSQFAVVDQVVRLMGYPGNGSLSIDWGRVMIVHNSRKNYINKSNINNNYSSDNSNHNIGGSNRTVNNNYCNNIQNGSNNSSIIQQDDLLINVLSDSGSSGGPVLNREGQVIGLLSRSHESARYSYVQPLRNLMNPEIVS